MNTAKQKLMKILICHCNPKLFARLMERPLAGQNVVIDWPNGRDLTATVAATEPHVVVLLGSGLGLYPNGLERRLRESGFQMPLLILPEDHRDDAQLDEVWHCLRRLHRGPVHVERDPENYRVLTEGGFELGNPHDRASEHARETQQNRFLALLSAGRTHHRRAQAYLSAAIATQQNYEQDWSLAVLSGDPRGYLWRAQLFRYVSTLAHYIPGVEVDCLPLPHPASQSLDFLHTALSAEAFYALNAIRTFGTNPELDKGLWEVGQIETRQGPQLAEDAGRLAGWAATVRQAASAHVDVMDACLSENPDRLTTLEETRHSRNAQSIFLQLWGLKGIVDCPGEFKRLTNEFHAGRRAVGVQSFYSFYEFVDRIQQEEQDRLVRN
jgi:hypothetical protein